MVWISPPPVRLLTDCSYPGGMDQSVTGSVQLATDCSHFGGMDQHQSVAGSIGDGLRGLLISRRYGSIDPSPVRLVTDRSHFGGVGQSVTGSVGDGLLASRRCGSTRRRLDRRHIAYISVVWTNPSPVRSATDYSHLGGMDQPVAGSIGDGLFTFRWYGPIRRRFDRWRVAYISVAWIKPWHHRFDR